MWLFFLNNASVYAIALTKEIFLIHLFSLTLLLWILQSFDEFQWHLEKDSKKGGKKVGYIHNMKGKNSFKFEPQILPKEIKMENDTPLPGILASVQGVSVSTHYDAMHGQRELLDWEGPGLFSLPYIPTLSLVSGSEGLKTRKQ